MSKCRNKREKISSKYQEKVGGFNAVDKLKLEAKNPEQKAYLNLIKAKELIFCSGSVGVGKTYIAGMSALIALEARQVDKIILSRPIVPCGERTLGYLKGTLKDKFAPYLEPYIELFNDVLGESHVEGMLSSGRIVPKPFEYLRGVTFRNSFVLLDEAQNTTPDELKVFLGRIGEGNKVIVAGDTEQKDIKGYSGLEHAFFKLRESRDIGLYTFPPSSPCIRNPIITTILSQW